jgi:outer membrane biosynthesis protein TonB
MEIVVSATGEVERVRLVNGPTRMPDMMLLSAAKSWRFRPALKDGEPVRYRTTASWTGFP